MHAPKANLQKTVIDGGVRVSLKHDSGHKHVSGEAVYVDDIREPPGTLQIYIAMSERAHAAVKKLDGALGSSPAALLAGSNEIEEYYNLDATGAKNGLDWLAAFPKNNDTMFEKVRMGFKGNTLDTMELYDHLGQVTVIRFGKIENNPKLAPSTFKFTPPAGADVISDQ